MDGAGPRGPHPDQYSDDALGPVCFVCRMQADVTFLTVPVFSTLCNAAFALRREVFVIEQQIPESEEFDADDLTATHLVAIAAGNVVGTLRITALPGGGPPPHGRPPGP